jgi:type IX secretion system PorP/SprF family membrane protein
MKQKIALYILTLSFFAQNGMAQDPHLSQFFSAPHFNNPALAGTQFGDWAVMANTRQQWGNASTPFNTQVVSADIKILGGEERENYFALGGTIMNDQTMNGAFRSNYGAVSVAFHKKLAEGQRLAAGFQGAYGHRRLDYSRLSFGSQFSGRGFDLAVANGETNLSTMKPFISLGAGILYTIIQNDGRFLLDVGLASYDINRPNQSFLKDSANQLNIRHVGYFNMNTYVGDNFYYQISGVYHRQAVQNYFSIGGAIGFSLENKRDFEKMFLLGAWLREGDALYPYVALRVKNFQIGLNYDITFSKQNLGPSNPRSLELSLVYTGMFHRHKGLRCPYVNRYVYF